LTGNRMGWTVRCGRPPLLLPSCRKLEFRLSAFMDSDLAWVNGKSGKKSWRYADPFQRSIISEAIYHLPCLIVHNRRHSSPIKPATNVTFSCQERNARLAGDRFLSQHQHLASETHYQRFVSTIDDCTTQAKTKNFSFPTHSWTEHVKWTM